MNIEQKIAELDMSRIPQHVAIIMDGNGRWARKREHERSVGHTEGVNSVNPITRLSSQLGVKYLSLYAFSTENWNRPQNEVDTLMFLIGSTIRKETPELLENNVRIHTLGDIDRLPESVQKDLQYGKDATKHCTGLNLILCLSYSSRWEITKAVKEIAEKVKKGEIDPDSISEETISNNLAARQYPDPDLLIRTGGEARVSNFLLWQIAYSELYFTPILWPDFDQNAYLDAILDYQNRERRFGKTSEQVQNENNNESL